uniref:Uncharacterized protein n=1 Tax=Klebsiella pneumoniae TaxID=573 RepID=A0A8B0SUG2_KLEPN|nr:hypothetical protein [Klebsiella pneumoniae]
MKVVEKNTESLKMCPYLRGLECHLALIQHSAADMCYVQVDTVLKNQKSLRVECNSNICFSR